MSDELMSENRHTVYIVQYTNTWPEDGCEIGGVYPTEEEAEKAAGNRRCAEHDFWEHYAVHERVIDDE